MKIARLLAVLALSCWVASVWPQGMLGGETWILLDRSPSMGAEPPLEEWLKEAELDLATWRKTVTKKRVVSFPHPKGLATADLGEAMRLMRAKVRSGDHLIVRSDGRNLGPLPDANAWNGIRITHVPPAPQPRFHQVIAPASWPAGSHGLWIRLRIADADLPNGTLDVTDASKQVTDLDLQNHGDGWLALRLRCAEVPDRPMELRLSWQEEAGIARTNLRLAAPSDRQVRWVEPDADPAFLQQQLQQGAVLVMADPGVSAWQALPESLAVFAPRTEQEGRPIWVLLDVSGSMEGAALEEARVALAGLLNSRQDGPLQVVPFQQGLLETLTLRETADLATLDALQAFGPTDLALALQELAPRLVGPQVLVVLSDGAADRKEVDWTALLQEALPETRVFCLPTGPKAEIDFLAGLGEVVSEGSMEERLDQVLRTLQEAPLEPVFATEDHRFPLPERWLPLAEHPAWQAADGAQVLLQDAQARAYLGIRRVGPGLLIGIADRRDAALEPLIQGLEQAFRSPMRDGWVGSRFLIHSSEAPPIVHQGDRRLEVRMRDVGPPVQWEALDPSTLEGVHVELGNGTTWQAGPLTDPEWGNPPHAWLQWMEIQRNGLTGSVFRPRLLWAGLILLTAAFVLRTLPNR